MSMYRTIEKSGNRKDEGFGKTKNRIKYKNIPSPALSPPVFEGWGAASSTALRRDWGDFLKKIVCE
jgi:hypothetical protein